METDPSGFGSLAATANRGTLHAQARPLRRPCQGVPPSDICLPHPRPEAPGLRHPSDALGCQTPLHLHSALWTTHLSGANGVRSKYCTPDILHGCPLHSKIEQHLCPFGEYFNHHTPTNGAYQSGARTGQHTRELPHTQAEHLRCHVDQFSRRDGASERHPIHHMQPPPISIIGNPIMQRHILS